MNCTEFQRLILKVDVHELHSFLIKVVGVEAVVLLQNFSKYLPVALNSLEIFHLGAQLFEKYASSAKLHEFTGLVSFPIEDKFDHVDEFGIWEQVDGGE